MSNSKKTSSTFLTSFPRFLRTTNGRLQAGVEAAKEVLRGGLGTVVRAEAEEAGRTETHPPAPYVPSRHRHPQNL
jgi:hypothetical protein